MPDQRTKPARSARIQLSDRTPQVRTVTACVLGALGISAAYQTCFARPGGPVSSVALAPRYGPPPTEGGGGGGLSDLEIAGIGAGAAGLGTGVWLAQKGGDGVGDCIKQNPEGAKIYNRKATDIPPGCAACHGKDGTRTNEDKGVPSLVGSKMTPQQMKQIILNGRKGEGVGGAGFMPAYDKLKLTDKQLDDLIRYIQCLQKLAAKGAPG